MWLCTWEVLDYLSLVTPFTCRAETWNPDITFKRLRSSWQTNRGHRSNSVLTGFLTSCYWEETRTNKATCYCKFTENSGGRTPANSDLRTPCNLISKDLSSVRTRLLFKSSNLKSSVWCLSHEWWRLSLRSSLRSEVKSEVESSLSPSLKSLSKNT